MEYKVNNLFYAAGKDLHNTFRVRLEMTEPVDPDALRRAVDLTVRRYPYFSVKMIRRNEEYVLVSNDAPMPVTPGGRAIPLGGEESGGHLMAVAWTGNLIYVDTSHFFMDGGGQFPFIKTLLYCYLVTLHPEEEFDLSGIALPDSEPGVDEADDDPFPEEPVPTDEIGLDRRPEEVLMLQDQPEGYTGRDGWTSFRMKVEQKEMMRFASSVDGSPASFIASVMYRAIAELHPDRKLPVVCGMQHQYRRALRKPYSHNCHVNIIPIVYTEKMRSRSLELLNTMGRGVMIVRGDDANDLLSINEHVMNEKKIRGLTLEEKHEHMKEFVRKGIGKNTFEVSYVGRVSFNGMEKYISNFSPTLDMSLSGGISIEIFPVADAFCIHIMQRNADTKYVDRFVGLLRENGIQCETEAPDHFEISDFVLP